jgi:glycosyltransferase involved in cell wall biosynthesis
MHIAQVLPHALHPYSGVLTAVLGLSTALARRSHSVEIWQLGEDSDPMTPEQRTFLTETGIELIRVPVGRRGWSLNRESRRAIAGRSPEVVHLHGTFSPANDLLAKALAGPYVFSPHGGYASAALARHRLRKGLFMRLYERSKLQGASLVFALTEAEAEEVRRAGYRGAMAIVPNGVEPPLADVDEQRFRRELGLRPHQRLAVFVGRLDVYYKRLDSLVRSFSGAADWQLSLVGPDWHGSMGLLERLIRDLGLSERVHLVGPRRCQALHEVLAAADLFVMASRAEGFPIALLEALAYGTPALLSPTVERATGVAGAGAGWVAPSEDLTDALLEISRSDDATWRERRSNAHRFVRSFEWGEVVQRYESALTDAGIQPGNR